MNIRAFEFKLNIVEVLPVLGNITHKYTIGFQNLDAKTYCTTPLSIEYDKQNKTYSSNIEMEVQKSDSAENSLIKLADYLESFAQVIREKAVKKEKVEFFV